MSDISISHSEIRSGEQFLTLEHFSEINELLSAPLPEANVVRAFSAVVKPKEMWQGRTRPLPVRTDPELYGLVVRNRESVGLPPQAGPRLRRVADLAVQANGFIVFADRLGTNSYSRLSGFGKQRTEFVRQVAYITVQGIQFDTASSE